MEVKMEGLYTYNKNVFLFDDAKSPSHDSHFMYARDFTREHIKYK